MSARPTPGLQGLTWSTAGESHGPCLIAQLEGLPAGLQVDLDAIRAGLKRRWEGYGRGLRAGFEKDELAVLSGLKRGVTMGSPLVIQLGNSDTRIDELPDLKAPRPGHADLAGVFRLKTRDIRAQLERASARETAARTALGEVCRQLLDHFEIQVTSQVIQIGGVPFAETEKWQAVVDQAREDGDSLGGSFQVTASGCPPGLGGFYQAVDRLDSRLMAAMASIPAVKAVSIGWGEQAGSTPGSSYHDPIVLEDGGWAGIGRSSNHAGGIEGGLTNGQDVVVQASIKPIPTLRKGLGSVNLDKMEDSRATYERSDVAVVEPASVVGEGLMCLEIAGALCARLGGVSMREMRERILKLGKNECPQDWPSDVAGLD
ncbi:MAG: chorismate synthase [Planctomycetota bacterium]|nr:MAG: chorismate synthase [Planctomycetota bacterium]